jgi:imidazolonepropionase-like amidohydrolase
VTFRKALRAGVKIVFGTDMGGIPWDHPIAREFPMMTKLGMAPMDAIKAATSRAAEMLDARGDLGEVAAGATADLIAVAGDPLKDIGELGKVRFVMKGGAVFKDDLGR